VSVAVAALLFGTANAAPMPIHNPQYGEIVHVAPDRTSAGSVGTGGSIPHPHIALGHDHNGNVIVAPVTHNSQSDHLKPHMPAPNEHGLGGVVRLDHAVAHPNDIQRSRGALRDKVLSNGALNRIEGGKALVQAHYGAAHAHGLAAQAHRGHEASHDQQSAHHFQTGNAQLGAHHAAQAALHRGHAEAHEAAANNHYAAAKAVNGPHNGELHHAQQSANFAHAVHQSFGAAAHHEQNGNALHAQGNQHAAQQAYAASDAAHQQALHHSATAVHHANQATAHVQ